MPLAATRTHVEHAIALRHFYCMAAIIKRGKVWQAQVARYGIKKSKTFRTKSEAKAWAESQEHQILLGAGKYGPGTVGDLFRRYAREVSPRQRGMRWEQIRLEKLCRDRIGKIAVRDLRAADFADWRDRRLTEVAPGTVRREMVLMSAVMTVARREWGAFPTSPMADVKKPPAPRPRDRLATEDEIARLVEFGGPLSSIAGRAVHAFCFAAETGMRAGEIARLRPEDVTGRVARLRITKSGRPRDVPLSKAALALLAALPPSDPLFGLTPRQIDTAFRRVRDRAGIQGLTFHDSRAYAATKMARKLDVLDLARVLGHSDVSMLIKVYYRERAEDLADRLG